MGSVDSQQRVLSGMQPTGRLHLGHYHGVLKNWLKLQHEFECFFFVADWHALTTRYEDPASIRENIWQMVIDWLAAGVNPGSATLFVQSAVPEHAELHLLLSMITPLGWLERAPGYKEWQEKSPENNCATYGYLGYPLLQSADILLYRAGKVAVGADQIPHVEISREIARRFNHLYGREPGFEELAEAAVVKLGKKNARLYRSLRKRYQEEGDPEALETARALLAEQQTMSMGDRERLYGYIEGGGRVLLPAPQAVLTNMPRVTGLDGQKMSRTRDNLIGLREPPDTVVHKVRTMPTDPRRVRRSDPGEPEKCPVWAFHQTYSDETTQEWVQTGCRSAGIGCLDCKKPVIEAIIEEQRPLRERAAEYETSPDLIHAILQEGADQARDVARETLMEVRQAMGMSYR